MKKLLLLFAVMLSTAFGAVLGATVGLNPVVSGIGTTALFGLASADQGIGYARAGFDISAINAQLGAYMRRYEQVIQTRMFQGIELEKYMRKVGNVSDEYSVQSSSVTEILQGYQCEYTPKGETSFDARINKVRHIKLDYDLTCIDEIYQSWLAFLAQEGVARDKWPFVKFIVQKNILPKIKEEIAFNSYNGAYVAPTAGTAGASVATVDGLGTIVANEITGGGITPVPTGAITPTNIVDKVEGFVDSLPSLYRGIKTPILMSETNARNYWRDYRNNFGGNANYDGKSNLMVDATSKTIIGIPEMNGSDRFIHTTKDNLLCMYDKIYTPNTLRTELEKRQIHIMGDFKRGYGIGRLDEMFVNDQA